MNNTGAHDRTDIRTLGTALPAEVIDSSSAASHSLSPRSGCMVPDDGHDAAGWGSTLTPDPFGVCPYARGQVSPILPHGLPCELVVSSRCAAP